MSGPPVNLETAVVGDQGDVVPDPKENVLLTSSPEFLEMKGAGNDLFKQERYTEAIAKYKAAQAYSVENKDDLAALLHNIGLSHEKMNDLEEAVKAYSEAITLKDKYIKVLKRRSNLLCKLGRYQEALDDLVDVVVDEIKDQQKKVAVTGVNGFMPGGFQMETSQRLVDILLGQTEVETQKVLANHASCSPPVTIVEAFLRMFNGDQVSRIWKGLEPSAVDEQIAQGKTDDLKGYMAALRDLKLKKYDAIVKHCTEEIENPDASEENVLNARFLRGTMTFIWTLSSQTVEDFIKVTESPLASNKMKSSAYLKLAMRHTNTRHPFSKSDTIQTISEDYSKAEELWVENPDIYYHGSLLLVDRAVPLQGLDMLEMGIRFCAPETSIMMKTFFWTLQLTITNEDSVRNNAYLELKKLEHEFDSAECHEMFGQALMAAGGDERQAEYNEQFDKAIACNPQDPVFKIKKLIFRHWLGENGNLVKEDHALAEMDSFIETEGPNNLAYYHIGQMEILRGNAEKGLEALEKSIELTGSIHEIEARVAAKLEMIFYLRVNSRLKEEGLEDLADQLQNLTLKQPFP